MDLAFLHVFELTVDGLASSFEFRMPYERDDVAEATDACAKYIARQEDNFLPLGEDAAVRAHRVLLIRHLSVAPMPEE